jgi:hypothetical protein
MCQSKEQGGLRCYSDECPVYRNAIKKGNEERVIIGGRSLLLTKDNIENLNSESDKLIEENKAKIIDAKNNISVLEKLQENLDEIEDAKKNGVVNENALSELQEKLNASAERRREEMKTYDSNEALATLQAKLAASENKPATRSPFIPASSYDSNVQEYRLNPSNLYDRCGNPAEHKYILQEDNVPSDYIYAIAITTSDPKIRRDAVKRYAEENNIDEEQAEASLPKSYDLLVRT